jgi:hypothetical protein
MRGYARLTCECSGPLQVPNNAGPGKICRCCHTKQIIMHRHHRMNGPNRGRPEPNKKSAAGGEFYAPTPSPFCSPFPIHLPASVARHLPFDLEVA